MRLILVVDDMPIFREPIEAVLRAEGFATATASDGQQALAVLVAARPALVLLDLSMPTMDGITVLKEIRQDYELKNTPVIILSAEADRARITEAAKLGISGYLLKTGFSLKDMLAKVKAVFAGARPGDISAPNAPSAVSTTRGTAA